MARWLIAAGFLLAGLRIGAPTAHVERSRAIAVPTAVTTADEVAPQPLQSASCGDGRCSPPEDCNSCPQDCGRCCGDGRCSPPEDCNTCPQDCGRCCGDHHCSPPEDCNSCPQDCGRCH